MTKLIIQIPCFNEAETIGATLDALPRELPGVDEVEWLIIDDGSTDRTAAVAVAHGADRIVSLNGHQGLARGFTAGLEACIAAGADIIVNTDADNQYSASIHSTTCNAHFSGHSRRYAQPSDTLPAFPPFVMLPHTHTHRHTHTHTQKNALSHSRHRTTGAATLKAAMERLHVCWSEVSSPGRMSVPGQPYCPVRWRP